MELSARSLRSARWPLMTSAIATLLSVLCQPVAAQTLGPTEALNANAAMDTSCDISSDVAVEPSGAWLAVWSSKENLGGTIWSRPGRFRGPLDEYWGAVDGARRIATRGQRTWQ